MNPHSLSWRPVTLVAAMCAAELRLVYTAPTRNPFVCITPLSQFLKHCNLIPPCCHMAPQLITAERGWRPKFLLYAVPWVKLCDPKTQL
jgi:hypothetical protein